LPSPPSSGQIRIILPVHLDYHDYSGQEDAALKKQIGKHITSIPTPDAASSPKRKRVSISVEGSV
jgi:hypothetical protein